MKKNVKKEIIRSDIEQQIKKDPKYKRKFWDWLFENVSCENTEGIDLITSNLIDKWFAREINNRLQR